MLFSSMLTFESNLLKHVGSCVPILSYQNFKNYEYSIVLRSSFIIIALCFFKKHINFQYNLLTCISGTDLIKKRYRFLVSYELLSLLFNSRLRLKVFLEEFQYLQSAMLIFKSANWWEREIWDLFGIYFDFHLDLRRILTDYGFEGYPLRKDFPLFGFRELRYNNNNKILTSEPIIFSQEFRNFTYESIW